jgi:hypothetical protein
MLWRSDKMKRFIAAAALLIGVFASLAPPVSSRAEDCYDDPKLVRSWVELEPWVPQGLSFLEKTIYRSGDGIALGIARAFTQEELLESERIGRILSIIRLSFSRPEYIARAEDRTPAVTRLLLSFLEQRRADKKLKQSIIDTESYVSSQVAHP